MLTVLITVITGYFKIMSNPFVVFNYRVLALDVSPMRSITKPNACITSHSAVAESSHFWDPIQRAGSQ
jgi:hypothetical protein